MATHEVHNQVEPLCDYNLFLTDRALQEAVHREGGHQDTDALSAFGALVGSAQNLAHGRMANENPPLLRAFNARGERINCVEYHPSYHHLMALSMNEGLHSEAWTSGRPGRFVSRSAKNFMMTQVEPGHGCPITMTFASVPALRHSPALAEVWVPRVTAAEYDGRNIPAVHKSSCTIGMAMTEKQGGSDVRANTTRATRVADGSYRLTGHKWFCSAPMSDAFLTLAHADEGLTCFLVPRWTPDGRPNGMQIQRLKDKLGNHSNASSEIEYDEAYAERVGDPGRGVRTIIDMVSHTRLDCVVASAGLIRQATAHAIHHARGRMTFGRKLVDHTLMQNVLADLVVESEAATALAFRLARAYEMGQTDPSQAAFARIATAIGKYWVCKRVPWVAYEAMECHGGNGYVEELPMARLYREAPLNSIWEGSGNVICLDVLRAMAKEPESLRAVQSELQTTVGQDERYDRLVNEIQSTLGQPDDLERNARQLVERTALALQANVLMGSAPNEVVEAFLGSRLGSERFGCFGTLPNSAQLLALVDRAAPITR